MKVVLEIRTVDLYYVLACDHFYASSTGTGYIVCAVICGVINAPTVTARPYALDLIFDALYSKVVLRDNLIV